MVGFRKSTRSEASALPVAALCAALMRDIINLGAMGRKWPGNVQTTPNTAFYKSVLIERKFIMRKVKTKHIWRKLKRIHI